MDYRSNLFDVLGMCNNRLSMIHILLMDLIPFLFIASPEVSLLSSCLNESVELLPWKVSTEDVIVVVDTFFIRKFL
jgi:hypothetical protein